MCVMFRTAIRIEHNYFVEKWESTPNYIELTPDKTGIVKGFNLDGIDTNKDHYTLMFLAKFDIHEPGEYAVRLAQMIGLNLFWQINIIYNI